MRWRKPSLFVRIKVSIVHYGLYDIEHQNAILPSNSTRKTREDRYLLV